MVYTGEISKLKRVGLLVEAIKGKRIDLIVIGNRGKKEKKIDSENVHFVGWIDPKELPAYLQSADFLIVTEDNDSALKLMEYLASRRNTLAPEGRISCLKKIYPQIRYYKSFEEIPKKISTYFRDKKNTQENLPFLWEDITKRYVALLKEIKYSAKYACKKRNE